MKLNVGCGDHGLEGYVNLDLNQLPTVNVRGNSLYLPFKNEVFERVYCSHMIEHLYPADAYLAIKEMHRVLRMDGEVTIIVPDMESVAAWWPKLSFEGKQLVNPVVLGRGWMAGLNQDHRSLWDTSLLAPVFDEIGFLGGMAIKECVPEKAKYWLMMVMWKTTSRERVKELSEIWQEEHKAMGLTIEGTL